jgi:hypothetical protein
MSAGPVVAGTFAGAFMWSGTTVQETAMFNRIDLVPDSVEIFDSLRHSAA